MTIMEKLLLTLFGIVFLSVLADAQDIGRMRRLMLLRQRELALRRAAFPFGIRGIGGIGGPGIPPPAVAARLALIQRQRGGSGNIFGQQPTQVFPNVPDVVQIPSVTPTGQPGGGQNGLTQAGAGQMGGQMNVQTGGQAGGQVGGQFTGSMGGSMTGTMGGPAGGPMGGPVSGPMGGSMGGPMGGPFTGPMGRPMGGPVSGSMGGSMGGPMRGLFSGPMGGNMGSSMGGPMGGPVSGTIGGTMGSSMGGPMGVSGPMGGSMRGSIGGPVSGTIGGTMGRPIGGSLGQGQFGGQMGGALRRSGPFGGQMPGPTFSFSQPSSGQFSAGMQTQGSQGSAIFPSQATQGPIIRQRGPGFTPDGSFSSGLDLSGSTSVVPGFPNGPALQFPDGAPAFGRSDGLIFPPGGFSPEVLSTSGLQSSGFPGFPGGSFGQSFSGTGAGPSAVVGPATGGQGFRPVTFGPSFDATPTTGQTSSQMSGGAGSQSQASSNFGFVGPSDGAAGPAFTTGTQQPQNFNLQFQPLQPGPQVPQIPEQQPSQGQMGLGFGTSGQANTGLNSGFSSQGNMQFGGTGQMGGSSQSGLQFGGSSQTGSTQSGIGSTGQNSKFTSSGSTTVVETNTEQPNGAISFGSNNQGSNSAATTISERTVESVAPGGIAEASTEFRLVEVGNILGDKGFVNNDAGSAVAIETTSGQQGGSAFQPTGDINTAFRSFEAVDGLQNFVDLSLEPTATIQTDGATISKTDATGSVTETNTTETKTVMSVQDGPFANSIKKDFSFFMTDNQAPNEMPPITFTAPEPPTVGSEGTQILTFPVQGTGSTSNTSQQGFTFGTQTVTAGKTVTGAVQPDTTTIAGETAVAGL